jgi:hypothetical protein
LQLLRAVHERSGGGPKAPCDRWRDRNGRRIRPSLRARELRRRKCDIDRAQEGRHVASQADRGFPSRLRRLFCTRSEAAVCSRLSQCSTIFPSSNRKISKPTLGPPMLYSVCAKTESPSWKTRTVLTLAAPFGKASRRCENCHIGNVVPDDVTISAVSEGVRGYALDPKNAEALWKKSEELVGESF